MMIFQRRPISVTARRLNIVGPTDTQHLLTTNRTSSHSNDVFNFVFNPWDLHYQVYNT